MWLGPLSLSLSVAKVATTAAFYESIGFEIVDGDQNRGWVVLRHGEAEIRLFERHETPLTLAFHTPEMNDVREAFDDRGIEHDLLDSGETIRLVDPDGRVIVIDRMDLPED